MIIINNNGLMSQIPQFVIIVSTIIGLAIVVGMYLLRSFGLYSLAKTCKINKPFIAFIPFAWPFILFKLIGEFNIFGLSFKKYALLFTFVMGFASFIGLLSGFLQFFPYVHYFFDGGVLTFVNGNQGIILVPNSDFINHFNIPVVNVIIYICDILSWILSFVTAVLEVFAFINLFKKFYPQAFILYSILSVLGLFPIFVFAIRNKKPFNFSYYRRNNYYNPYGPDPYNNNQNYNENGYNRSKPAEPFEEFEKNDKKRNPFDEFDDKH